ncbi:hypothetical protein [Streptomyces werraensis]|uniref:hypothetical protein n=1 Tax=Streptomyces werraensis TaxID=68284 RepID=UPI003F4D3511
MYTVPLDQKMTSALPSAPDPSALAPGISLAAWPPRPTSTVTNPSTPYFFAHDAAAKPVAQTAASWAVVCRDRQLPRAGCAEVVGDQNVELVAGGGAVGRGADDGRRSGMRVGPGGTRDLSGGVGGQFGLTEVECRPRR